MKKTLCFLILSLLLVNQNGFALSVTPATVTKPEIASHLSLRSDLVVAGKLRQSETYFNTYPTMGQEQTIVTRWQMSVQKVLKGKVSDQSISVIMPGGCIAAENICFKSNAIPEFHAGDDVLFFLNQASDDTWFVFDIMNGFQRRQANDYLPLELGIEEISSIIEKGLPL